MRSVYKPLLLMWFLTTPCHSKDVLYHPDFKTVPIPQSITLDGTATISAPIGDVTVQSPIIKVMINNTGPYFFMLDTGFSGTLISKRVATAANLPVVDTITKTSRTPSQVITASQDIRLVKALKIGDVTLNHYGVSTATDDSPEYAVLEKQDGRGIDGILGFNAFYGLKVQLDYNKETITFSKDSLESHEAFVVPISKKSPVPIIQATIKFDKLEKRMTQDMLLDTGASNYFFINSCDMPQMQEFTGKEQIIGSDYTGLEHNTYLAQLYGSIQLSKDYHVPSPYILYAPIHCEYDRVGLIGKKFFEKHEVIIDVDDRLVKIKPLSQ